MIVLWARDQHPAVSRWQHWRSTVCFLWGPENDHSYFIVIDKHAVPCKASGTLSCLDELFKAHFVFGTSYSQHVHFALDVDTTMANPWVAESRARMLHKTDLFEPQKCFESKCRQTNANCLVKHLKLIHGLCQGKSLRVIRFTCILHLFWM